MNLTMLAGAMLYATMGWLADFWIGFGIGLFLDLKYPQDDEELVETAFEEWVCHGEWRCCEGFAFWMRWSIIHLLWPIAVPAEIHDGCKTISANIESMK